MYGAGNFRSLPWCALPFSFALTVSLDLPLLFAAMVRFRLTGWLRAERLKPDMPT
jgi:hypothetical protein